jgi:type I restriction enzyme S subunit
MFNRSSLLKIKNSMILTERKEYSEKHKTYPHVSLTIKGIEPKTERFERDFLVKEVSKNYKVTKVNDLCYNPANLKFGVITLNETIDGIFSPIYVTFEINRDLMLLKYAKHFYTRDSFIKSLMKYQEGTVYERMAVKPEDFLGIEIEIHKLEDQQKIGSFLNAVDELIEKSKKRELQLFSFQKTQLEKLFKANDNNYTLIPLNHLAKIFDGTHQTPNYVDSGVPFVSVEDIKNLKITSKYISQMDFERNFKIYPIKGDILMTRIGDIGTSSLFEENYPIAFYVSLALIKCKGIVPKYLNQFIKSEFFQRELNKRTIHAAFPKKINLSEIGNCIVLVPSQEVQLKIGEYLTNLSKLIELESKRRMLYEKAMKEYLERIFGG